MMSPAVAAPLPDAARLPLDYAVVDQDLRDVLTEIGRHLGVPVQVTDAVRGRVRGRLPPGPASEVVARLAAIHGLEWYFDGATLFVSTAAESVSRLVPLRGVRPQELRVALDSLGLQETRFPLRAADDVGLALVAGPPRYVSLVEQTLAALSERRGVPPAASRGARPLAVEVRVFRGRTGDPA